MITQFIESIFSFHQLLPYPVVLKQYHFSTSNYAELCYWDPVEGP